MSRCSSALTHSAVEVTIREEYLLRNKTNLVRTLCAYSLDNGPWHETDDARFIFRFTAFDWSNNIEEAMRRENIHCDEVLHLEVDYQPAAKKIGIIGSDTAFAYELIAALRAAGYSVGTYHSGRTAVEEPLIPVDLFIIDKHSRDFDSLQTCRHLRAHPHTRDVPILLLSAEAKKNHEALLAGATDCIEKSLHVHYLLNVIAGYVRWK